MAKVNLALLGGFRLQTNLGEPVPLSTKKAGALLAYLVLHPGQAQARPKLAALLWGDRTEAQARDSLRQALSLLRKALSHIDSRALVAHEDAIGFEPTALTSDVVAFCDLAARQDVGNLEQASALYGGELLDGFEVPAPEFESWMRAERERFRELALAAMTRLLDHHLSNGSVERGIHIAARLLTVDPLQERIHRTLMELYHRQGRHSAALRQYRTCADLLTRELGIEPDASSKALRREILREWNQQQDVIPGDEAAPRPPDESDVEAPATPRAPERRQVTVLAYDLVGTSALAAQIDPEELEALIAAYRRCCTPIVSRAGGVMGKLSATEMVACFGHPQAHEHDIECAVRAGLALVDAVPRLDGVSLGPLQLRAGIATGPVVFGDVLGDGADQQVIAGEAVQLASGLQKVAAPGTVLIAASTRQFVGNLFDCNDLGELVLNGVPGSVRACHVLGPSGVDSRFEALRAATTPLIGREEELDLLERRWRHATEGEGRVVLLAGEPGIGKSRLTVELQDRLREESHARLPHFCSPHHRDNELYPIISQLERAAGFRRDETDEQRLDKLEAVLAPTTNEARDAVPLIANLLSVTSARHPPLNLTPQKRKEKTLQALLARLEGLAARAPVLIVFEDVHWIDPTSLELLDLMVERVATMPVLLVITFRPEFAPAWIGRPQVTLLALSRLPPAQRAQMIVALTGGRALPQDILDQIVDRTDGVPLFVEELTRSVMESGVLDEAGGRNGAGGQVIPLAIPSTLQASLLARLDRLPETHEVVQIGAALGRSFSHELIAAVARLPQHRLDDALARLVEAGLIFRRGIAPDAEYTFKHALVQDAAYGTLSRTQRQLLHGRITKTLEEQFPETVTAHPALLAHHSEAAGLTGKAVGYLRQAGQQAIAHAAMTEAETQLLKGISLLEGLPEGPERRRHELRLQIALGSAWFGTRGGGSVSAGEAFDRARELCAGQEQADELPTILTCQAVNRLYRGEPRSAYQLSDELLDLGRSWQDKASPALRWTSNAITSVARYLRGQNGLWLGEFASARADTEEALRLLDPARLPGNWMIDVQAVLLSVSMGSLTGLGYLDQARARRDEALARAREVDRVATSVVIFANAAICDACMETDPAVLLDQVSKLEAYSTQHGFFSEYEKFAKWHRQCYLIALGRSEPARLHAEFPAELHAERRYLYKPTWFMSLAEALGKIGRSKDGLDELDKAEREMEVTGERWAEANLHRIRGELLVDIGDAAAGEASLRRSIDLACRQSAKLWELRAATSLARLWRGQRKHAQARDLLAPVYAWFTEGLDTPVVQAARILLEQLA
ncbi:BTAD domain-containing putative transcriptional regulator [Bradyrhizobium sp. Cp5.3]|uniref:BTAD domain-containing putative transcriptional regulator n=1 Tax=Bradyrhizobium sp. Cp5.3 TaxID=443598 RepID=UPI0003F4BC9D|nr:BTAD domain-containing putative transcriptional regulator [Bradyrhizobium sp. Cp5.3]